MTSRILMLCALLLLPALALGQASTPPPPGAPHPPGGDVFYVRTNRPGDLGAWWKDSEIVRQLQLSDAQVGQIEKTFLDARLSLIKLRADVEIEEAMLQPLVDADQMDEAKISAQLDKLLAARAKLEKANTMMMFDIRKVLTVEQWKKLRVLQRARSHTPMAAPEAPGPRWVPRRETPPPPGGPDDLE
jgi:Spy/CpxP family protein refolding chaperone